MIDIQGKIRFSKFELKMGEDLRVMWSTFHCYTTNGPIEMDAKLERSN